MVAAFYPKTATLQSSEGRFWAGSRHIYVTARPW